MVLRLVSAALAVVLGASVHAEEFRESPDAPTAFSTTIYARDYDDRFETVEDLIDHAAGVRVRRLGGVGAHSTASIRGAKPEQTLVLLDGVRLNSAYRGQVDLSTLSLRSVDRIEIRRGSGGSRYGSDAVGGVISITTRRADDAEPHADAAATTGSYGMLGADLGASFGTETTRSAFSYSRLRTRNDFPFQVDFLELPAQAPGQNRFNGIPRRNFKRLNAGFLDETGLLRFSLDTGVESRLDATLHLHRKDRGQPGGISGAPLADATNRTLSCTDVDEQQRRGIFRLAWSDPHLGPGGAEIGVFHRYERGELRNGLRAECRFVDGYEQWIESSSGLDASFRFNALVLGGVRLGSRASAAFRLDRVRPGGSESKRRLVGNGFVQQEIGLAGGRLRLIPALGVEVSRTSAGSARTSASVGPARVSVNDDPALTPRLGALFDVLPGLRLKANYARSFRRPNFTELFHPDFGFIRGNPLLSPEEAWNFDAGFELATEGSGGLTHVRLQGAYFHRDVEQSIEWIFGAGLAFEPMNTGALRYRGYELEGAFTLWERLDLSGSYTLVDAEVRRDSSLSIPHVPRNRSSGRAALRLPWATLFAELAHEDPIAFRFAKPNGRVQSKGGTQIDAGVTVRPARLPGLRFLPDAFSVSLEWSNLTEKQRVDSLESPLPNRSTWTLRVRGATP